MNHPTRFDLAKNAWLGLKAQGFKRAVRVSYSPDMMEIGSVCAYRTEDGRKCAIGHSIPDEAYSPDMEGRSPLGIFEQIGTPLLIADEPFVNLLQRAHDFAETSDDVERNLRALFQMYNIQIEAFDESN